MSKKEHLRERALAFIESDSRLQSHIRMIEIVMNLADRLIELPVGDADENVIHVLAMRTSTDFCASLTLALAGYWRHSFLVQRGILETVFLLDLFKGDRSQIKQWRLADDDEMKRKFNPGRVRDLLDSRDGFKEGKRKADYDVFSKYTAHPTKKSEYLMKPQPDGEPVSGAFFAPHLLIAALNDMGRLAVQFGDILIHFFPETWIGILRVRNDYACARQRWKDLNWTKR